MKKWYEELFENYANTYDKEIFTKGTIGECDFLESEINRDKSLKILDIGCGTGRHSIEMAKRGYHISGIDFSSSMLEKAKEKALAEGLEIDFSQKDARLPHYENEFDLAIMLCEGGFSLMETDEMNYDILKNAYRAIKNGGKFIFTALNALFPLYNSVDDFHDSARDEDDEGAKYINSNLDLMTFRIANTTVVTDDSGNKKELLCNERYYAPSEITWQLKSLGFKNIGIYSAKLGKFSREELSTNDFELLVIAEK